MRVDMVEGGEYPRGCFRYGRIDGVEYYVKVEVCRWAFFVAIPAMLYVRTRWLRYPIDNA